MKSELEKILKNSYPELTELLPLKGHVESFEHEDGWFALVSSMCDELDKLKKIRLEQVKEKFGGLRVYYCFSDDATRAEIEELKSQAHAIIDKYAEKSLVTCSYCGSISGRLMNVGLWMMVLCDECKLNRDEKVEKLFKYVNF